MNFQTLWSCAPVGAPPVLVLQTCFRELELCTVLPFAATEFLLVCCAYLAESFEA